MLPRSDGVEPGYAQKRSAGHRGVLQAIRGKLRVNGAAAGADDGIATVGETVPRRTASEDAGFLLFDMA